MGNVSPLHHFIIWHINTQNELGENHFEANITFTGPYKEKGFRR